MPLLLLLAPLPSPLDLGPYQYSNHPQPDLVIHKYRPGEMTSLLVRQFWCIPRLWIASSRPNGHRAFEMIAYQHSAWRVSSVTYRTRFSVTVFSAMTNLGHLNIICILPLSSPYQSFLDARDTFHKFPFLESPLLSSPGSISLHKPLHLHLASPWNLVYDHTANSKARDRKCREESRVEKI